MQSCDWSFWSPDVEAMVWIQTWKKSIRKHCARGQYLLVLYNLLVLGWPLTESLELKLAIWSRGRGVHPMTRLYYSTWTCCIVGCGFWSPKREFPRTCQVISDSAFCRVMLLLLCFIQLIFIENINYSACCWQMFNDPIAISILSNFAIL